MVMLRLDCLLVFVDKRAFNYLYRSAINLGPVDLINPGSRIKKVV